MGLLGEATTAPRGFPIASAKIPILLRLKRIDELKPHEETVQKDLAGIVKTLQRDPVLRHPIIADSKTGAVLDGTHRLAATKELDCRTIPVALIDYQNPMIEVDRWYRTIKQTKPTQFHNEIVKLDPETTSDWEGEKDLLTRVSYATLRDAQQCLSFKTIETRPVEMSRRAFAIETIARNSQAKIEYSDKYDTSLVSGSTSLMSTIRLEKKEVIESCRSRDLFPPKSTRHIIPSRPLGITVSLNLLKNQDIEKAELEFEKHLSAKTIKRLPEGSFVGSRRYAEEVFLFE